MIGIVILVVVVLAAATIAALFLFFLRPLPKVEGMLCLAGLEGRVEILRDEWGVPHIYAGSAHDLFLAQGYIHAQDRLWQMELQRRAGSGRLSEVLGEVTLGVDRFFRTVGLNRAAEAEFETLDAGTRGALEAYAAGINAYLASYHRRKPVEFKLLRFDPEPWQPVDSLYWAKVMAWNLGCNWDSELIRARLAVRLGADRTADLEPLFPADNPAIVQGQSLAAGAAPPPNGWRSEALREALHLVEELFQPNSMDLGLEEPLPGPLHVGARGGGSNQWVVAGSRTGSGKPLLANDTHMVLQIPAIWYQVHLDGGDYHVTGVSLPGLPGVVVGHNERCAWGMTTAWQDAQDLYVERLNPANPHQYEFQGAWLDAEVISEEIRVKGRTASVIQEVVITRHGPIISGLIGEPTPLALRWVALEPSNLLRSALSYNRARNWSEFRAALADWSAPAHNFVYADVDGNIGFLQAGWMPVRGSSFPSVPGEAGDHMSGGLAPVPGWTGENEWQFYLPLDELPQAYNPEDGWLATANNLVVDAGYPYYLSADLENPCRARRVADLLASQRIFTADDFARFQHDTYSVQAERFVRHLLTVEPGSELERRALDLLKQWDGRLEPDSVAASLYQVSRLRALYLFFEPHLGDLAGQYIGLGLTPMGDVSPYHARSFVRLLDLLDGHGSAGASAIGEDTWLCDPATGMVRSRQALLSQALCEAIALLQQELGPDMARWQWSRLNKVHFAHPVGSVKPLNLIFNRGPYPLGGDQDTLLRARSVPRFPFPPASVVAALCFIADLDDWEKCRIVIPGGQSGHVASRHYADLVPLWLEGRYQPMPFARAQVERAARHRLDLAPV
ncbi:MAG: penicillin acylase family protein [Anaerolineae bacterium]|nr:penicillin acylase family protein [Anaerolineae bacterium]